MCELTDPRGDFWRRIHAGIVEPTRFMGYTFFRRRDEQALREKQAVRRADAALNALCKLEAATATVFEALEGVPFEVEYRRPHLIAALADAYRAGDHAELGRIVADEMRRLLEQQAEDAADEKWWPIERTERDQLERSAA